MHLHQFINDFGIIILTSALVGLIFKWLSQPVSLAYLVAGFLLGPHFSLFTTVTNEEVVKVWAEIGIIFVFFNLGLELSFKKFRTIGPKSLVAAMIEIPGCFFIGYLVGDYFGFTFMERVFLGAMMSISSTTIISKSFEDLKFKSEKFAGQVFGILIFEDVAAIILLVLLSTVAVTQRLSGQELTNSVLKITFFLTIVFVAGTTLIPSLIRRIKNLLNDEMILLLASGFCLFMGIFASEFGLSAALGAFLMGMIFSNTGEVKRIEELTTPLRNIFTAIFFVSVGMMINPKLMWQHISVILVVASLVILCKFVFVYSGCILSGSGQRDATRASFSMAQIGEFSFIIAALGVQQKVISDSLYSIAIGVSLITTFLTPFFISISDRVDFWLKRSLPERYLDFIDKYDKSTFLVISDPKQTVEIKEFLVRLVISNSFLIAITAISYRQFPKVIKLFNVGPDWIKYISFVACLLMSTPFYWSLIYGKINQNILHLKTVRTILIHYVMNFVRYILIALILSVQVSLYVSTGLGALGVVILLILVTRSLSKKIGSFYTWLERGFVRNLSPLEGLEVSEKNIGPQAFFSQKKLDTHMQIIKVNPNSIHVGKKLIDLKPRENFDVNLVMLQRGKRIEVPIGTTVLCPLDEYGVVGEEDAISNFKAYLDMELVGEELGLEDITNFDLYSVVVDSDHFLKDKVLREVFSGKRLLLRVVGIQRLEGRMQIPGPDFKFQVGDIVWLVGRKSDLEQLSVAEEKVDSGELSL
jgi:monovalent cation:H+ antiporter-2, CPA2 family